MNTPIQTEIPPIGSNRRNGNVARLPKILRDKINTMLDDGATYAEIVAELDKSPLPHPISVDNITRWKQGGYQDYLRAQDWRERLTIQTDRYSDPAEADPVQLATGALHIAMLQLCELMDKISEAAADEPHKLVGITNSLSRLSRSLVLISEHRDAVNELKTKERADADAIRAHDERVLRQNPEQDSNNMSIKNWLANIKSRPSRTVATTTATTTPAAPTEPANMLSGPNRTSSPPLSFSSPGVESSRDEALLCLNSHTPEAGAEP